MEIDFFCELKKLHHSAKELSVNVCKEYAMFFLSELSNEFLNNKKTRKIRFKSLLI